MLRLGHFPGKHRPMVPSKEYACTSQSEPSRAPASEDLEITPAGNSNPESQRP